MHKGAAEPEIVRYTFVLAPRHMGPVLSVDNIVFSCYDFKCTYEHQPIQLSTRLGRRILGQILLAACFLSEGPKPILPRVMFLTPASIVHERIAK